MAKKKKKKSSQPPGLRELYDVGEEMTVKAVIGEGEEREVTKTPVRITTVGYDCLGVEIIGNWGRKFVRGFEFEIENVPFRVISEQRTKAVLQCLDENMYTE